MSTLVPGGQLYTQISSDRPADTVQFLSLEGEDHRGIVRQLGEDNSVLVKAVIGMIKTAPQPAH
jgi:hypothetical protein